MPANLPPQYKEAENRYRQAKTIPEKIMALQEMLAIMPKHKGTDHLRADLRARLARLTEQLENPTKPVGGRTHPFSIRKEGAGQAVLVGPPNVGKSQLLNILTGAEAKVGAYPFTTQLPLPGMLRYQNVYIQVVDAPAVVEGHVTGALYGLLRNADVFVLVVDLTADPVDQTQKLIEELGRWGFRILNKDKTLHPDAPQLQKRAVLVGNKADELGAVEAFQDLAAAYGQQLPVALVSAAAGVGTDELAQEIFSALDVVRVYTKPPGREADLSNPMVMPVGSTVEDMAEGLHKEWRKRLKYALLWGSGKFQGQRVGRNYVLADGDVVEIHV